MNTLWHICIDTGGTFTDCIATSPDGQRHRAKVLSSSRLRGTIEEPISTTQLRISAPWNTQPDVLTGFHLRLLDQNNDHTWIKVVSSDGDTLKLAEPMACEVAAHVELTTHEPAPILAARLVTATPADQPLPAMHMRLATTRGTNALLERAGAPLALFITQGFGDLLYIGDQQRPDLFALQIDKRKPLHAHVVQVDERLQSDGSVLVELDEQAVRRDAAELVKQGITVAAVALMHSYRNDQHEQRIAQILRDVGFEHASCSAELAPLIEILPRTETAVVDAYLALLIQSYLSDVRKAIGEQSTLHVMTSAGGLVQAADYRAKDSLLSGPAGGVAGAAAAGNASGYSRVIGFDMGGTSTDVARFDGDFEYRFEHTVAGVKVVAPALAIETVAAGGGSICEFVDDRLRVGPRSAGADPGPACYGAGGPLVMTDVNLLMGRLDAEQFEIPIDRDAASRVLDELAQQVASATGKEPDRDGLLDGFLAIANERMADAIASISLRRGYDPADYALVSFGGAGGQNACAVASRLNITTIIMPRDASLLSAVGLSHAAIERFSQRQILASLDDVADQLASWLDEAADEAIEEVAREGIAKDEIFIRRRIAHVRLQGQDTTLPIEIDKVESLADDFAEEYQRMYGYSPQGKPIEVDSIRVVASSQPSRHAAAARVRESKQAQTDRTVRARFDSDWLDVPAYDMAALSPGDELAGPAIIFDQHSAYVIEQHWTASIDGTGAIIAKHHGRHDQSQDAIAAQPEVAKLELFTSRLESIAEDMGQVLQRTALSTNVKRRLDFSCGVLDAAGRLVVNAPHIPVHLGALGLCVRSVQEQFPEMQPGDVYVTNHPAFGGSHLPDITVITPVFVDTSLLGFVASRAHHAELGGTRPGSMPPAAKSLVDEGVVIKPRYLVREGQACMEELVEHLRSGPHPSRAVDDNIADLQAAVAANHRGSSALEELARNHGTDELQQRMNQLRQRAATLAKHSLAAMDDGRYEAREQLDDESTLAVAITIENDHATIDFEGTSPQHAGNLNATPAIVQSAVLYVLRLMIGERLPLNEGILEAVTIKLPACMLNPTFPDDPQRCPAVVGGNTETSQRLVDTLLKAFGLCACSQGTMNNVLFGNDAFGYYETVCGGSGAGPGFAGADAVHTHMTNTRMTDTEVIEHRYPVRVERFSIRSNSGGDGQYRGGRGVIRELTFLEPVALSVLTQHRKQQPYGGDGGEAGACGQQRVIRANRETITLQSIDQCDLEAGDRFILETPGGGGWGKAAT